MCRHILATVIALASDARLLYYYVRKVMSKGALAISCVVSLNGVITDESHIQVI
jgi:hypothetical protein